MSVHKQDPIPEIYYPESDGEPMAETDLHAQLIIDLRYALKEFFRDQPDVYVSGNLLLYYVEGNPRKRVSPDVFVARGVGNAPRRVYKLWQEGHAPDVVIEVSSRETYLNDLQGKWELYKQLEVKEYFIFDPEYRAAERTFLAFRLRKGGYKPLAIKGGRVLSRELGLELVDTGQTLRLYNPTTRQFLPTEAEMAEARQQAETARQQAEDARRLAEQALQTEAEARRQAEEELARLRRELERLRGRATPPAAGEPD